MPWIVDARITKQNDLLHFGMNWTQAMGSRGGKLETPSFSLLFELDMSIEGFSSNWAHCDKISTYAARMIGHNRRDSLLYSNLFSSAFNELLETVFRSHHGSGNFACRILRNGETDRIELTIPCDEHLGRFYAESVESLADPDREEKYRAALFSDEPLTRGIGLMELAVDYAAEFKISDFDGQAVRLTTDLILEESEVLC